MDIHEYLQGQLGKLQACKKLHEELKGDIIKQMSSQRGQPSNRQSRVV